MTKAQKKTSESHCVLEEGVLLGTQKTGSEGCNYITQLTNGDCKSPSKPTSTV